MIQKAFSSMALYDCTTERVAEFAAQTGYDGVELRCSENGHLSEDMSISELRRIRRLFEERGVKILSISGYVRFTSSEKEIREKNLDSLCRQVEMARELGALSVRSLGGSVSHDEWKRDPQRYIEMLGTYLRRAAERTEGSEVTILQETHDNFSPAKIAREVVRLANHPRISLLWCVIHPLQEGEDLATTWKYIQGNFRLVHFKDALYGTLHEWWPLRRLGCGELPLSVIARLLKGNGYEGPVSIEWEKHMHPEIEDSEIVLREGIGYMSELFSDDGK